MDFVKRSKEIFQLEIDELAKVAGKIGTEINDAIELIYNSKGKLVIMGIGKTGIIGHKIASSLASTGTQSIFVNAAEAMHGDLGMVSREDVVLLISNSGTSNEIVNLLSPVKRLGCKIIAMTGNPKSALAQGADLVLNVGIEQEACPLGLAPTTSTTATLVMGDALTVCLMERRSFKAENFALYHPGGALGRQLLTRVKDRMTTNVPKVYENALFNDIIYKVSDGRLGMTMVYNLQDEAIGIITDGDIRRAVQREDNIKSLKASDFMTRGFKYISQDSLLSEALAIMDENNITTVAVVESENSSKVVGILHIHHIIDFR